MSSQYEKFRKQLNHKNSLYTTLFYIYKNNYIHTLNI